MAHEHLSTYLNDHLAGATSGLELIAALRRSGSGDNLAEVEAAIAEDRHELEQLMQSVDVPKSSLRPAAAWAAEKLAELKTRLDDLGKGPLYALELFEALSLGIEGKRGLWEALKTASPAAPALQRVDFARLIARAEEQRRVVEAGRLNAAARAFGGPT
jgi:hypothetical protein